ncbi:L-erythro-3,5-diaminohexanoate dehydrogenase (fragment) [Nostocoides australiense Ben110]|uniref:L-erythro-3,5-diaminohexanoate dehydrogenase n=1 Tax=Nostocoides australiense Ben110 TaxID=1193182 RepID=W6K3G6_9MICO
MSRPVSSPVGLHRVLEPAGESLPQAACRLDATSPLWPDEVRVAVETLNLDAASYRQLAESHTADGVLDAQALKAQVLDIVATRGKMQNPVTGSGGMLIGTVEEVGPESTLGLAVGDRVATLVSLSLTPLVITDGLASWDGRSERVPAHGHAILFGRSIAAKLPEDLSPELALMVMDVCGAPALVRRVVESYAARGAAPTVLVLGGAGKSGSLALAQPRPRRGVGGESPWCPTRLRQSACVRLGWPMPSSSPMPALRWGSRRPSQPPVGRPT